MSKKNPLILTSHGLSGDTTAMHNTLRSTGPKTPEFPSKRRSLSRAAHSVPPTQIMNRMNAGLIGFSTTAVKGGGDV